MKFYLLSSFAFMLWVNFVLLSLPYFLKTLPSFYITSIQWHVYLVWDRRQLQGSSCHSNALMGKQRIKPCAVACTVLYSSVYTFYYCSSHQCFVSLTFLYKGFGFVKYHFHCTCLYLHMDIFISAQASSHRSCKENLITVHKFCSTT